MKKLRKEDFPLKLEGLTLKIDSDDYLRVIQDRRHGIEEVLVPCRGNGYFDYKNSVGERYFIYSAGIIESKISGKYQKYPVPIEKISLKKMREEFADKTKEELELLITAMLCANQFGGK